MKIPHRDQTAWTRADLRAPKDEGYVLIALAPARPAVPTPLGRARASRGREALYQLGAELARRPDVLEAAQMRAVITAPGSARGSSEPRWKDVLLVRTRALPAALAVADQIDTASLPGSRKLVIAARSVRRIADVSHEGPGPYLLNFFTGPSVATTLNVWEHTAGWFQDETSLTNSTVLQPHQPDTPYTVINHCSWPSWWRLILALTLKPSFHSFVLRRFRTVGVSPHPVLYRVVSQWPRAAASRAPSSARPRRHAQPSARPRTR